MVGDKRHLLTFETRAEVLDTFGEAAFSYTELARVWGKLEAVSARERFDSQQTKAEVSHRITVRYGAAYAGLRAEDRITLDGRVFDIVTPMDRDGRSREIEILALERL